jgi:hypothetical protein
VLLRRATLLLALVALLAAPAAALAHSPDSSASKKDKKGTLSILHGKGTLDLQAQGAVIGKVRKGKVKVKIYKGKHRGGDHGQVIIRMRGKGTIKHKANGTLVYNGRNIRIRIVDQKFRLKIDGVGIHLSAVAQGTCVLQASPTAADPGVFSLNGGDYQSLPDDQTTYQLGSSGSS